MKEQLAAQAAHEVYGDFNADTFDWGDDKEDGIVLADVDAPNLYEDIMAATLANHDAHYDWTYVKRSELRERAGRKYEAKIVMPEEHREWFEKEWPEYVFVWDKATRHHDHPVSHLCTELNEIEMTAQHVAEGTAYIDLFGNMHRDAKYKRKALTLYTMASGKDHLRYFGVKEGPYIRKYDEEKLMSGAYEVGTQPINEICISHALYYWNMDQIARWCNSGPLKRIRALVHRHQHSHGELNRGEQEYWVSEEGVVTQKNVDTGEPYSHPSLEGLFHQYSASTKHGGVAWTVTKMGGDTYQFEFVSCKSEGLKAYVPLKFLKPETRVEWAYNNTVVRGFLGWTWMTVTQGEHRYVLEDCDLTDKLRRYIAGKPRNARMKTELMNYARRLTNKADIIAIHGGGAHEVMVGRMSDYVENAFYCDAQHELEVAMSYWRRNHVITEALNAYYETGKMPLDVAKVQKALKVGVKTLTSVNHMPAIGMVAGGLAAGGVGGVVFAASAAAISLGAVGAHQVYSHYSDPPIPPKW